ncbi:MAG: hypothetical protein U9O18_03585 [Chloroflexota bacterium]|nr:hypothetical protein [Chloroflexota bacterium]
MKTSLPRVVLALFTLTFLVVACGSETGAEWTYAPVTASESEAPAISAESAAPEVTDAPAEITDAPVQTAALVASAEPEVTAAAAEATDVPGSEARVIQIEATGAMRFHDAEGQPLTDIAVTPGETISFQVENTAGFPHNFWIGTDEELIVMNGTTDAGIPDWSTGVEVLEWVVPEDISGLKFGCTVPGHYSMMQGTFSAGEAPAGSTAPVEPVAATGEARVIEIEADAAIRFLQNGEQLQDIAVTPGETVIFRIENTAGFPHNFYIGPDEELAVMGGSTDTGLPDWNTGFQELEWVVPEDISGLRFACTVPGHYFTMQGDFTVSP